VIGKSVERTDKLSATAKAVIMVLLSFVLGCLICYSGRSWGDDFIQYFAQTRAILNNSIPEWYEKNIYIINTSSPGVGSDVYPWIWSILLMPVYGLVGDNFRVLKIYEALYFGLCAFSFFYIAKNRLSEKIACIVTLLFACNVEILISINTIESDIANLLFVFLVIILYDCSKKIDVHKEMKKAIAIQCLLGLFCFIAKETRTMSFALILALVCSWLFNIILRIFDGRLKKNTLSGQAAEIGIGIIPAPVYWISGKIFYCFFPKSGGTYNDYFLFTPKRFFERVKGYYLLFSKIFGSNARPIISIISICGFSLILILSIYAFIKYLRSESFVIFFSCGTLLMLLFYDYADTRFAYPIYPFFILFAFVGFKDILSAQKNNNKEKTYAVLRRICGALLVTYTVSMLIATGVSAYYIQTGKYNLREVDAPETIEAFEYIKENIDEDKIICFGKPRLLYYYTNVYSYTWFNNSGHLEAADYYLWTIQFDESEVLPYAEENGTVIFENDWYKLYQFN